MTVDYEKIREMLLEIQEMLKGIPEECKGDSKEASENRKKFTTVKHSINYLLNKI